MKRLNLRINGIVQGVGFRPFVYKIAIFNNIRGMVNNTSEGILIDAEGEEKNLNIFLKELKYNTPPLAKIENLIIEEKKLKYYTRFEIGRSRSIMNKVTLISPDIATCGTCIRELKDSSNKRYKYPFINCTNCGPRFSIIKEIPYDREKTTMKDFKMCIECTREYKEPLSKRFHTEPNACKECGPKIWIENSNGLKVITEDETGWTRKKLKEGKIFAIKGLGGFHLVCEGTNKDAVKLLRDRKNRPHKPFAIMVKNIEIARKYCSISNVEEELLTGGRKPIVILNQLQCCDLPEVIAPHQKSLGVMLPYTPIHHMLFEDDIEVLIMTSGNAYGLPLEFENKDAIERLRGIADYYLLHNREIYNPIDDSVVKVVNDEIFMIRRARGYTPEPVVKKDIKNILALGSNMKNTFCISKGNFLFVSQHNGDMENLETIERYENNIDHFRKIFSFRPEYVVCDMHPNYFSNKYADKLGIPIIRVQHHHAHIVSCLAENNINKEVIGVAYDGTGYGVDGKLWGGEFLLCSKKEFKRLGQLEYIKMPGGEKAIKEPWRMGEAYIYNAFKTEKLKICSNIEDLKEILFKIYGEKSKGLLPIIDAGINCPETSSIGRLFDGVSSIIGLNHIITYEGQAAIELESLTTSGCLENYTYSLKKNNEYILETGEIIDGIIRDKVSNISNKIISSKFHNTIIKFTKEICNLIRIDRNINEVALSGGVFQNTYLFKGVIEELRKDNFTVYTNKIIPSNDGGISLGQIIIGNEILH